MIFFFFSVLSAWAWPIDRELQESLADPAKKLQRVVVHLQGKFDFSTLPLGPRGKERGRALAVAMKRFTEDNARDILKYLRSEEAKDVREVTLIWITNSIRVQAHPETIEALLFNPQVASVTLDKPATVLELDTDEGYGDAPEELPPPREIAWGVEKIRASDVWKKGFLGQGVVIAHIDSGVHASHLDLRGHLWENKGETGLDAQGRDKKTNGVDDDGNGWVDDVHGWNFEDSSPDLRDRYGHGTGSAGILVGDGAGGVATGVAPRASLMVLRTCCSQGKHFFESNNWLAYQYALTQGAQVISQSMSKKPVNKPRFDRWRYASEALLHGGILHVNSAGNLGTKNAPSPLGAPSTNPPPWIHPTQGSTGKPGATLTVGAVDEKDLLREYSSYGTVSWEEIFPYLDYPLSQGGLKKPELCAPSGVPSLSWNSSGYVRSFGGTSSATPHVAGAAALLLSAYPELSPPQIVEALERTAVRSEQKPFQGGCGAGRIDVAEALRFLENRRKIE